LQICDEIVTVRPNAQSLIQPADQHVSVKNALKRSIAADTVNVSKQGLADELKEFSSLSYH